MLLPPLLTLLIRYPAATTDSLISINLFLKHHDNWPAAFARPTSAEDIASIIKFVKKKNVKMSVKCGGHSNVSFDGSLVIDLFKLNKVVVNADANPPTVKVCLV